MCSSIQRAGMCLMGGTCFAPCLLPVGLMNDQLDGTSCHRGQLLSFGQMLMSRPAQAVEVTIQNLITSGMDPKTENDPYLGFIYTSFQERATKISHGNTAAHAAKYGECSAFSCKSSPRSALTMHLPELPAASMSLHVMSTNSSVT